jgi:hypothetical protein
VLVQQAVESAPEIGRGTQIVLAENGHHDWSCVVTLESELPRPHTGGNTLIGDRSNLLLRTN